MKRIKRMNTDKAKQCFADYSYCCRAKGTKPELLGLSVFIRFIRFIRVPKVYCPHNSATE
jgi:hypothetical protein